MLGFLLIATALAFAVLVALTARLPSLVSTLLVGYLALVADIGLVTLVLSPFDAVTRGGLSVAQSLLLAGAAAAWWMRGRPRPSFPAARAAGRELVSDPVTALFLVVVALVLAYELVLALTVPPNNGDALAYHMTKAAAWAQHGGVHWIDNAPTVRINAFQPLAEQQLLFLFVATGSGRLFALPQYLAELVILVAVYGASRRLGFGVRAAACAACLLATFSLVALEATTAQNDLVAAAFPAIAACFLLGRGGTLEWALAGSAVGLGLGVKLSTALVLPILVWLALLRGRRALTVAVGSGVVGFLAIGMWGYVLNYHNTGHVLGLGTGHALNRASPSYPGSVANAFYLLYGMADASVLSSRLIHLLALAGLIAAAAAVWAYRRAGAGTGAAIGGAARVATPFLAGLFVIGAAGVLAWIAGKWGFPIRGYEGTIPALEAVLNQEYGRIANENYSAFGPVGIVALVAATVVTLLAYAARRVDARHLALACALPAFFVVISLMTFWNPFLIRFFLVPAVLAAPLLGSLFRSRAATATYLAVATITIAITLTEAQTKPLENPYGYGRPWNLTQQESLATNSRPEVAAGLAAFESLVPDDACVGAILGDSEASYFLYGSKLGRRVTYLSVYDDVPVAIAHDLVYIVISAGPNKWAADRFAAAGWRIRPLAKYWLLADDPRSRNRSCAV